MTVTLGLGAAGAPSVAVEFSDSDGAERMSPTAKQKREVEIKARVARLRKMWKQQKHEAALVELEQEPDYSHLPASLGEKMKAAREARLRQIIEETAPD